MGLRPGGREEPPLSCPVEHDCRNSNRRPAGQLLFGARHPGIARHEAEADPVGVDHDVDEVRIIEGLGGALVGSLGERPGSETTGAKAAGTARSDTAAGRRGRALTMEVVIVPKLVLAFRGLRLHRARDVLDVVSAPGHEADSALRPQCRNDARPPCRPNRSPPAQLSEC